MSPQFRLSLCRAVGILALALFSTLPAACAPLSDAMRQADPRLQKRVTLVASHILIGELLEKLSAQSGVSLTVGDKDGAGDPEVLVSLKDVPLDKAMNALYSLVSYQKAEWEWEKTGEGSAASYRLAQPPAARELAATLQKQIMADVVAQGKKLAGAVKKTPEELKEAAKTDLLLHSVDADYRVRTATAFFTELPADVQARIMQGGRIRIPVAELSPGGKAYVAQEMQWQRAHNDNPKEPTVVTVFMHQATGSIAPGVSVACGFGGGELFGGGFLEKEWRGKIKALWLLPGDARTDNTESHQVALPKDAPPILDKSHSFHNHYLQLSEAANVPVIARLFNEDGFGTSAARAPYGLTMADFLSGPMGDNGSYIDMGLAHKWRDGVLLVAYNGEIMNDKAETRVPWAIVKRLRDSESAAPDGFLPVSELFFAARHLTRPQMSRLADWFPVMAGLANWHDLFSLAANSSDLQTALLSKQGSTRADALSAASGPLNIGQKVADGTAKRVRLTLGDSLTATPPMRNVMVEALRANGEVTAAQGLGYPKRQFISAGRK